MKFRTKAGLAILALLLALPFDVRAQSGQSANSGAKPAAVENQVQPQPPPQALLPDKLGPVAATGEIKGYGREGWEGLKLRPEIAYEEYPVVAAASRQYGSIRVDVFQLENHRAAYGLFSTNAGGTNAKVEAMPIGSDGAMIAGAIVFWKESYFIQVQDGELATGSSKKHARQRVAEAVAAKITPTRAEPARPSLIESLPKDFKVSGSERYFLGPESLYSHAGYASEMFSFDGDAEAALAEYRSGPSSMTWRLVIVEHHTPQFATAALARANKLVESLPEDQRDRVLVDREGNFIVAAVGFEDRDFARQVLDRVEYPYTVKWLRDPLLQTTDPFHIQKAAQLLLSTFMIMCIMIGVVLVFGTIFGTTIFFKRRKQQQETFSDAGGMLRLEIDPFEARILGLPPKRD